MERRDVIVIATVSCIYGLGMPEMYRDMRVHIEKKQSLSPSTFAKNLINLQYERNEILDRGHFRMRGDVLEVFPAYMSDAYRIELDWEEVSRIRRFNPLTGETIEELDEVIIYPAKHFVVPHEMLMKARDKIKAELDVQYQFLLQEGKMLEAERLKTRTNYDLEMLAEMGYCSGIENYSAPIGNRPPGVPPATLLHYFPKDFLCFIDESHVSKPNRCLCMRATDHENKTSLTLDSPSQCPR